MQQRNTRQRQIVLDAVRERMDHPTADEIYLEPLTAETVKRIIEKEKPDFDYFHCCNFKYL